MLCAVASAGRSYRPTGMEHDTSRNWHPRVGSVAPSRHNFTNSIPSHCALALPPSRRTQPFAGMRAIMHTNRGTGISGARDLPLDSGADRPNAQIRIAWRGVAVAASSSLTHGVNCCRSLCYRRQDRAEIRLRSLRMVQGSVLRT